MGTGSTAARGRVGAGAWRLWALLPIVVLAGVVSLFAATGGSLLDLVGRAPPPLDQFDIRQIEFKPGEIRVRVTNPQRAKLTVAAVTVDDAIVPFRVDGPETLSRLRSSTVVIPFHWVEGDPYSVGITSSHGVETRGEVAAAVVSRDSSTRGFLGYAVIGLLVGVVPVALGLAWLPSLRRADARWLAAFMALTAGLLTFLALDAFAEALELQASLPSGFQGPGLILLGVAVSYLGLTLLAQRLSRQGRRGGAPLDGLPLAGLIAVGIGLHNLGEGLAIGSSVALGEVALGTFLIVGFMVHNLTEGLGIATPIAAGGNVGIRRLATLAVIAGAPAIVGAWIGGFLTTDLLGVFFFALAVGAALQVVVEVGRYVMRRAPGGLRSGYAVGGYLVGITVMYVTGLLVG